MSVRPLHSMVVGEIAIIRQFSNDIRLKARFMEMGMTIGTEVRMIKKNPFKGPIEIKIRSFYVAIRYEDANWILID